LFNIPDGHTKITTPITTVLLPIATNNIKVIIFKYTFIDIKKVTNHSLKLFLIYMMGFW